VTKRRDLGRVVPVIHDVVMAVVALLVAFLLRYGFDELPAPADIFLSLATFGVFAAVAYWIVGLGRGIWRFTSVSDLRAIVIAATITVVGFLIASFLVNRLDVVPRSVPLIAWFVLIVLLGAPRILYRIVKDSGFGGILRAIVGRRISDGGKNETILIVGSTTGADRVVRTLVLDRKDRPVNAIGIVDVSARTEGLSVRGVPILGSVDQLEAILDRLESVGKWPSALVIAAPREDQASLRGVATIAARARLPIKRVGATGGVLEPGAPTNLQPLTLEDLLGRPPVSLDLAGMRRLIESRVVLVTGAGGSIGSEIVRQVAALAPRRLILLDSSEFNLYTIDGEVSRGAAVDHVPVLGSVRDRERIERLFREERPDIVFHAAALKHVPMVEANACEGVLTNVAGSRCVADAAVAYGARAVVMISSDKAVKPTSIMGATKRVAESYCQALDVNRSATRFITVRFGNVLGSTGSVVPRFEEQIRRGGPVTVTHPEMQRYFMTIREATELVLQAAAHGLDHPEEAGSIHVLDMGEPVKIVDLARTMIALAGLKPDEDVAIEVTGIRPGEKLYEEYFDPAEATRQSATAGVLIATPRIIDRQRITAILDDLTASAERGDRGMTVALLRTIVPDLPGEAAGSLPKTAVA
jgi:O-antigen biosynthesis protein WbqV